MYTVWLICLVCPENIDYFFLLSEEHGCLFRSIQLCVFGTPHIESADVEEGGIKGSSKG